MYRIILVGIGGFFGASLRYIISGLCIKIFGDTYPYGTLLVNVLGGFFIGLIMELSINGWPIPPNLRIFLTTGFLGGLTTFSTFGYETISMLSDGSYLLGTVNIGLNLILSLAGVWLGKFLAQILL